MSNNYYTPSGFWGVGGRQASPVSPGVLIFEPFGLFLYKFAAGSLTVLLKCPFINTRNDKDNEVAKEIASSLRSSQ